MSTAERELFQLIDQFVGADESTSHRGLRLLRAFLAKWLAGDRWRTAELTDAREWIMSQKDVGAADVLFAHLYCAVLQHRYSVRDRHEKAQYLTVGTLLQKPTAGMAALTATAQGWFPATTPAVLASVPATSVAAALQDVVIPALDEYAGLIGVLMFFGGTMAIYFETFDPQSDITAATYGAAYQTLGVDPDLGSLVDNAYEVDFLAHLVGMLQECVHGDQMKLSAARAVCGIPWPEAAPSNSEWALQWCEWVNREFRAWIELNFRVSATKTSRERLGKLLELDTAGNEKLDAQSWAYPCERARFTDLATYHAMANAHSVHSTALLAAPAAPQRAITAH